MAGEKLTRFYRVLSIVFFNTFLCLICLNLAALAYGAVDSDLLARPTATVPHGFPLSVYGIGALRYDFDLLQKVYYYREDSEIIWLLLETWNLTQVCDEAAYFREAAYHGRYVHVDPAGFRHGDAQGAWPPDEEAYNIFVFGGSTTFGYGESDNLTIPSYLQYYLRQQTGSDQIFVYNFGRANYFSLQEKLLFQSLVDQGIVPDMAIFIDGLNDFISWDGLVNHDNCGQDPTFIEQLGNTLTCQANELCLPLEQLALNLTKRTPKQTPTRAAVIPTATAPPNDDPTTNRAVIERWLANKQDIEQRAQAAGVELFFVMQPVPSYAYDLQYHLFADSLEDMGASARPHWGYAIWEEMYNDPNADWTANVLNLTHLGEDNQGPIYLDGVHYSFGFMDEIAQAITQLIVSSGAMDLEKP